VLDVRRGALQGLFRNPLKVWYSATDRLPDPELDFKNDVFPNLQKFKEFDFILTMEAFFIILYTLFS